MAGVLAAVTALAGITLGVAVDTAGSSPAGAAGGASSFATITPCRIVDTRQPGAGGAFTAFSQRDLTVTGTTSFDDQGGTTGGCGIPASATAVEATITAVGPTGNGYARAWPAATAEPNATFLNFTAGGSIGNTGTIPITNAYAAHMTVKAYGPTHIVIDINGYFAPEATLGYDTITPCRIVDTRAPGGGGALGGFAQRDFTVTGSTSFDDQGGTTGGCAIPATAVAVEATITAVSPSGNGFARAWPSGTTEPTATFLNFSSVSVAAAQP